jgi:hypothetical protein
MLIPINLLKQQNIPLVILVIIISAITTFWKRYIWNFEKNILHLKATTPNCMIYGELGRYPLDIDIQLWNVSYWAKLLLPPRHGEISRFQDLFENTQTHIQV